MALTGSVTVVVSFSVACSSSVVATVEPSVAAGAEFTCGVTRSGSPYCWGLNFGGSLGNGRFHGRETAPTPVDTPHRFRKVGTGTSMVCGITEASELHCWGASEFWVHASPLRLDGAPPEGWSDVTVGAAHGCGLSTAGTAYCWGDNFSGRLGDGTTTSRGEAVRVSGGHRFKALSAGSVHTCGVDPAGRAYCWGDNSLGNLGIGTRGGVYASPVPVAGDLVFESVTAGTWHSCGVTGFDSPDGGGNAYCWGENAAGSLGIGDTVNRSTPTLLPNPGGAGWSMLSAGRSHTCGVTRSGEAYCWGANPDGRLGDGTLTQRHAPTPVAGDIVFRSVSAGDAQNTGNPGVSHTCGVSVDGNTYCWGGNPNGGLGDGSTSDRTEPVLVRIPE